MVRCTPTASAISATVCCRLPSGPVDFVHAAGRWRPLPGGQLGLAAAGAAATPGSVPALAGALDDQLALELIDRAEDMEDQSPPVGVVVSICCFRTTRPAPRSRSSSASADRCFSDRIARGQKKTACGVVSLRRHCPDQVPGGRRSASELSPASQPFLPAPDLPRHSVRSSSPSITSQTIFTLHGADDGRLGSKARPARAKRPMLLRSPRPRGTAALMLPGLARKAIHWRWPQAGTVETVDFRAVTTADRARAAINGICAATRAIPPGPGRGQTK